MQQPTSQKWTSHTESWVQANSLIPLQPKSRRHFRQWLGRINVLLRNDKHVRQFLNHRLFDNFAGFLDRACVLQSLLDTRGSIQSAGSLGTRGIATTSNVVRQRCESRFLDPYLLAHGAACQAGDDLGYTWSTDGMPDVVVQ